MYWSNWLYLNREALANGVKIEAPTWLGSLGTAGFRPISSASYDGQAVDWALSLDDRSRIHVHEYADGRCVVHRDRHDPDRGFADMAAHLAFETPFGVAALAVGTVWLMSQEGE